MSLEENRNINQNMMMNNNMLNNMNNNNIANNNMMGNNMLNSNFSGIAPSFNNMISQDEMNTVDCELREEMMEQIRCLEFAINDLALYLDTHPEDEKALCLHRKYCKQCKDLRDKYQKVYGPLTINFPCNKWRWLEEPWPWERGNF